MYAAFRVLVLMLVLFPVLSALAVWPLRQRAARRVALWLALIHLGLTAAVVGGTLMVLDVRNGSAVHAGADYGYQRFQPDFIPGDPGIGGPSWFKPESALSAAMVIIPTAARPSSSESLSLRR